MTHSITHGYEEFQERQNAPQEKIDSTQADPNEQLGFEISPVSLRWSFTPEFYPDDFTQMKKRELNRHPSGSCSGENVSLKAVKNREYNATGVLLQGEINVFQALLDHNGAVDLLSPLCPKGGAECYVKQGELGKQKGWDPHTRQWYFEYSIDLVATSRDETENGNNSIVTAIIDDEFFEDATIGDDPF
jgi:hypothetical protein